MNRALVARKQFQGVLNVVRFNWPIYAVALVASILLCLIANSLPLGLLSILCMVIGCLLFNLIIVSLGVSFWVYDLSELYEFDWLVKMIPCHPARVLNLHAGFDETSVALKQIFPNAQLQVFDFYSPLSSTETSIARARAASSQASEISLPVGLNNWSLPDCSQDLVLVFLAAHELRKSEDRDAFFCEIYRVLSKDGRCILIEHHRDFPNFFAYGVGSLHFFSHREWLRVIEEAGFTVAQEKAITPFVKARCLCK